MQVLWNIVETNTWSNREDSKEAARESGVQILNVGFFLHELISFAFYTQSSNWSHDSQTSAQEKWKAISWKIQWEFSMYTKLVSKFRLCWWMISLIS